MVTCCSGYGWKWIIGLTSALIQRADTYSIYEVRKKKGEFLRPSEGGMLQSFKFTDFSEMCQGIIHNPVLPRYVVCLLKYCIDGIL